jgi:signal transduction histidine kinase
VTGDSHAHTDRLGAVVRAIFDLRLFAVAVTLLYLPSVSASPTPVVVALLVSLVCSFLPLVLWQRISHSVLRHPTWLAVDLCLSIAVLTLAGPESPFFLATLGTAALAGIVYGVPGATVFTSLLLFGWAGVLELRPEGADDLSPFQAAVTLPALYPLCAAGGAAVRRLLDQQAETERSLLAAEHASSVAMERARVAREMHDSVGKSLQGIALSASALATSAALDHDKADAARRLAGAARVAAVEARELIGDLRADDLDAPLHETLAGVARSWAQGAGVRLRLAVAPVAADADARYEILAIVKEALRNVERHAQAESVRIVLEADEATIRLTVADDGCGLPGGHDDDALVRGGHFGLLGMRERAERIGGELDVARGRSGGTTLTAVLPAARAPEAQRPQRFRLRLRSRSRRDLRGVAG